MKEVTRGLLAEFLRVSPEEIILTRNTSESNNLVSSGLDLKDGDEVVIFEDNHPSNNLAWVEKARRFGFTVKVIPQVNPHPGPEYYLDAYRKQLTSKTKIITFTHLTRCFGASERRSPGGMQRSCPKGTLRAPPRRLRARIPADSHHGLLGYRS